MLNRFRFAKRIVVDLPKQLRLAYCLLRDPRVPVVTKVAFTGGLGALLSPWINIPEVIPVVGELDTIAVTLLALKLFIAACPDEVVVDNEQLIIEQRSRFDEDVRKGERVALAIYRTLRHEKTDITGTPVGRHSNTDSGVHT